MTDTRIDGSEALAGAHTRARARLRLLTVESWPIWLRWAVTAVFFVLLATALVARYIPQQHTLSRADEYVYIDAVDKATHLEITRRGALVDQYALRLLSCIGVEGYPQGSPCSGPYELSKAPWAGGHTSADIHPPTYYFVTAGLAEVIRATTPADDLLTAARLTGGLWLGLGLTMIVALSRALGASRGASGAAALLALSAPSMRWSNTFVTPDALNILAGAAIALAAVNVVRRRWSPWWLMVACAVAGAVKSQDAMAAGLAFLILVGVAVARWLKDRQHREWGLVGWAFGGLAAAVIPQAVWLYVRSATALGPAPGQGLAAPKLSLWPVAYDSTVFMRGIVNGPNATYPPAWAGGNPITAHGEIASWLLTAAVVGLALFVRHLGELETVFGRAALVALVAGGPVLRVVIYEAIGSNFGMPDRYGHVLFPAMAASLAVVSKRRWVIALVGVLAVGFLVLEFALFERW